jgi:hypothetical protein
MALPAIGLGLAGLSAISSLFGHKAPKQFSSGAIASQFGPDALNKDYQRLFSLMASNPGFQGQLAGINMAGQNLGQGLAASFANRGLTSSGVGTIAQNLGNATGGFETNRAVGELSGNALTAAQQSLMERLRAWAALQGQSIGQPSGIDSILGSLFGAAGPAIAGYSAGLPKTSIAPNPGVPLP